MTRIVSEGGLWLRGGLKSLRRCMATVDGWSISGDRFRVHYYDGAASRYQARLAIILPESAAERNTVRRVKRDFRRID